MSSTFAFPSSHQFTAKLSRSAFPVLGHAAFHRTWAGRRLTLSHAEAEASCIGGTTSVSSTTGEKADPLGTALSRSLPDESPLLQRDVESVAAASIRGGKCPD
jgi:hypothetical protein